MADIMADADSEITARTVRATLDAWARGDLDAAFACCDGAVEFRREASAGAGGVEAAGRGAEAVREALLGLAGEFEIVEYETVEIIAQGPRAATRQRIRMRHRATGAEVAGEIAGFWTVRGGKVTALHEFADTAQEARARAG